MIRYPITIKQNDSVIPTDPHALLKSSQVSIIELTPSLNTTDMKVLSRREFLVPDLRYKAFSISLKITDTKIKFSFFGHSRTNTEEQNPCKDCDRTF
jgi:hypothetical protein